MADRPPPSRRAMDARLQNTTLAVALALMVGWILYLGRGVLIPVVFAILINYMILGLANLLARDPLIGARLPGLARTLLAICAIMAAALAVVNLFEANLGVVLERAPAYQEQLLAAAQRVAAALGVETAPTWETLRGEALAGLDLQALARSALSSVTGALGVTVLVALTVAFLLVERRAFRTKLALIARTPADHARLTAIVADVNASIGRYLAVKTLINIGLGLISWAIMAGFGLEFAAFWALLIGLFNYVPYIGSFIGVAFPAALGFATLPGWEAALLMLAVLAATQMIVGDVVEPLAMGDALNLSPLVILISLTVWSSLWGVAGALFCAPLTAIAAIVCARFRRTRPIAVLLSRDGRLAVDADD